MITHQELNLPTQMTGEDSRKKFRMLMRRTADRIQQGYRIVNGAYTFSTFSVSLTDDGQIVLSESDGSAMVNQPAKREPREKSSTSKPLTAVTATAVAKVRQTSPVPKPAKKQQLMFPNKERIIEGFDTFIDKFEEYLETRGIEKVALNFENTWYSFMMEQLYLAAQGSPETALNIVLNKLKQMNIPSGKWTYLMDRRMIGFGPVVR